MFFLLVGLMDKEEYHVCFKKTDHNAYPFELMIAQDCERLCASKSEMKLYLFPRLTLWRVTTLLAALHG